VIGRCSDEAIAACVVPTLRALHDADGGEWSRTTIAQLAGLLAYAERRRPDSEDTRRGEVAAALGEAAGVAVDGSPYERAAAVLVAAVGSDPRGAEPGPPALRAVLVAHLDDELAQTAGLLDAFRGRLPDA
jgi:hypothetical protein